MVAAANAVLGMIRRTFLCKSKELILQLYKSLVRLKLEYLSKLGDLILTNPKNLSAILLYQMNGNPSSFPPPNSGCWATSPST